MNGQNSYDVVIVGAGVAGAILAWKLGSLGCKVVVLEAGPADGGLAQRQQYVASFKETGLSYPFNPPALKPNPNNLDNYYVEQPTTRPSQGPVVPDDPSDPFDAYNIIAPSLLQGDWFQTDYERQAGGTTWHWLGTSLRFLPNDFKLKTVYNPQVAGLSAQDWPFQYEQIEPWYGLAEKTIGVSGPSTGEEYLGITRSTPYPIPEIPQSYLDQQIVSAVQGQSFLDLGTKTSFPLTVSPTPQGRNSAQYGGRPQCQGSSSCIPICPIQAKYDATQHVQMAIATGNVTFLNQTVASQVQVDSTNPANPVSGIQYITWTDQNGVVTQQPGTATGKIYVLAAHAVENAKLLLNSPWGTTTVANSSDQVGRNLADHPVSLVYAQVDNPVYGYRGPLSTSGIESLRDGQFRNYRGAFRMELGNDGWEWPIGDPTITPARLLTRGFQSAQSLIQAGQTPLWGADLASQTGNYLTRQMRIGCLAEQLPDPNSRVQLSSQKDVLGIPQPQMSYRIDEYGKRSLSASVAACLQVFKQLISNPVIQYNYYDSNGVLQIDTQRSASGTPNLFVREGWAGAGHIMGTHRMGNDPTSFVVDGQQRSHDHSNLFLLGSGNWPSFTTANPTLTIAALALWAAATINTQLKS